MSRMHISPRRPLLSRLGRTPPLQGKGVALAGGIPAFRAAFVQADDAPPPSRSSAVVAPLPFPAA
jgi:hypothetical protein